MAMRHQHNTCILLNCCMQCMLKQHNSFLIVSDSERMPKLNNNYSLTLWNWIPFPEPISLIGFIGCYHNLFQSQFNNGTNEWPSNAAQGISLSLYLPSQWILYCFDLCRFLACIVPDNYRNHFIQVLSFQAFLI